MTKKVGSTKDQILQDFRQLFAKRKKLALQIATKEETAEREKDKDVVRAALNLTTESIVKGLADLQLAFGQEMEELANTLISEASKLEQVRRAIEIETRHLNELADIKIAANALDILVQEEKEKANTFEEWSTQQREAFAQDVAAQRQAWQKEQEEHQIAVARYDESLRKERELAEADFAYKLERQRKTEMDKYQAEKRKKELEIAETEREKQKQWSEREKAIAERSQELQEYKTMAEAFSRELEEAIKEAREKATQAANDEAKVKADLFKKEIEANKEVRELKIQTLEATIATQTGQIETLAAELREALKRAQDLAVKAIASAASTETHLTRQAKSQGRD